MKFVVISDIHGRADLVDRIMSIHSDRDGVLFLGDGTRDIWVEELMRGGRAFAGVRGNCDPIFTKAQDYDYDEELLLNIGEYTVIMMHGHTRGVKSGIERAVAYSAGRRADILLYGHTHVPAEIYYPEGSEVGGVRLSKPMWVLNPGSVSCGSYGLLQIKGRNVLLSHGYIN